MFSTVKLAIMIRWHIKKVAFYFLNIIDFSHTVHSLPRARCCQGSCCVGGTADAPHNLLPNYRCYHCSSTGEHLIIRFSFIKEPAEITYLLDNQLDYSVQKRIQHNIFSFPKLSITLTIGVQLFYLRSYGLFLDQKNMLKKVLIPLKPFPSI